MPITTFSPVANFGNQPLSPQEAPPSQGRKSVHEKISYLKNLALVKKQSLRIDFQIETKYQS